MNRPTPPHPTPNKQTCTEICVPYVVALLSRLVLTPRAVMDDYLYYATPSPWLQVRHLCVTTAALGWFD